MENLFVGAGIAVIVGVASIVIRKSRRADVPTQRSFSVPTQLDRADFGSPEQEWLVVVFTSATCPVCADVSAKAQAVSSRHVATRIIDYPAQRDIHERYGVDAVPMLVIADSSGVVRHHVLGPVSATDLWAAVARVRDGSEPETGSCSRQ